MSEKIQQLAPHVTSVPGVCGGKPCIAGTRIRVWDIHIWHHLRGQAPEEIATLHPQLSVADVHAGLMYYLDHREEIERQMEEAHQAAELRALQQAPSKYSLLKDALLNDVAVDGGNSISS